MRRRLSRLAPACSLALFLLLGGAPFYVLPFLPPQDECGKRPLIGPGTGPRIVGGHDAQLGAWPWQVSLQVYELHSGYDHVCGGSLISNNSILTAAHCIKEWMNPTLWRAVIGLHNRHKFSSYTVKRRVKTIMIHSNYSWDTNENDVALFMLIRYIKYNKYVQPICLPDTHLLAKAVYPCYITGWGSTQEKGRDKLILQEAQVDIIPLNVCNSPNWYGGQLTLNMLCAGSSSGHVDSCQGDSGGPLMCYFPHTARFYLIGVTSFGYGCGRPRYPGIYVHIAHYRSWIDEHLVAKTTIVNFQYFLILWNLEWIIFHIL
ncbi:transmembrane protease serine 12-like [Varanus komodoensis]|uniref:transmembrane protease serine 12-like n=1 Tax=Varanus komodoensis TaxID=61221 RepID=UPI001CF76DD5|nr:transmembrane protease serine 12-like [Varanus komodoensis]